MSLERLRSIPVFTHKIDEYELGRMDPTDAYIARKNSELQQAIDWNNDQTLALNNAVVDQNEEISKVKDDVKDIKETLRDWDTRYEVLVARIKSPLSIILFVITLFAPSIISWVLEHYISKK